MPFEYQMLAIMTLIFMFAWIPSSIAKWQSFGTRWLASNRSPLVGRELVPWGARVERAYANLKDYFPAFAVAIILLGILQKFDYSTSWAAGLFVAGRIIHFIAYGMGNVSMRFLSYTIALSSNLFLLVKVFI